MGQGIGAGGGGQFRRQTGGQFRVENDHFGQQFRMKEDRFAVGRFERDHGTAPDFAARAGRGRDGDERRQPGPVRFIVEFAEVEPGPFDQDARGLAGIQGTAAADGDHAVALLLAIGLSRFAHVRFHGIRMDPGIDEPGLLALAFAQDLGKRFESSCALHAGVGDDQGPADIQFGQARRQFADRAGAIEGWGRE